MPTVTRSFPATQATDPPTSARTRVLEGGSAQRQPPRPATTAAARPRPAPGPRAQGAAVAADGLPRWAKGVVIGGLLLAVAMPATVLMSRSMLVQEALAAESGSKAAMVCTGGNARAVDSSSITGWLFGGSFFSCGDWETRDARVQRERDRYETNYMARERTRQGLPPN
ncbi:hypothetical protein [Roseateles sp.]|uniref:hypothetical protein n=1 Tax=Roseateles sp. TaxID=1971397 RepID=UPI0032674B67